MYTLRFVLVTGKHHATEWTVATCEHCGRDMWWSTDLDIGIVPSLRQHLREHGIAPTPIELEVAAANVVGK
jgi:hypothetical protein